MDATNTVESDLLLHICASYLYRRSLISDMDKSLIDQIIEGDDPQFFRDTAFAMRRDNGLETPIINHLASSNAIEMPSLHRRLAENVLLPMIRKLDPLEKSFGWDDIERVAKSDDVDERIELMFRFLKWMGKDAKTDETCAMAKRILEIQRC